MNSWTFIGEYIKNDGLTADTAALANKATTAWSIPLLNAANENVLFTAVDNVLALSTGTHATNHCWTAVHTVGPDATTAKRVLIGGYTGSITTCLKHAIDGYSFWGAVVMAKLGDDWAHGSFTDTNGMALLTEVADIPDLNKIIGLADATHAGLGVGSATVGLNLAQVRVIHINYSALTKEAYYLLTSSEYYYKSILLSVVKDGSEFAPIQGLAAATLANATYGAVWNFWPFKAAEVTATTKISAQDPDTVILVGVKGG